MKRAVTLVPLVGIMFAIAIPLVRYTNKQRDEQTAIDALARIRAAQRVFHTRYGGYASTLDTAVTPCPDSPPVLDAGVIERLRASGYVAAIRPAMGASARNARDCHGRALVDNYYLSIQPQDAAHPAQLAFASRADGDAYIFYDGIAPTEAEIDSGLATPLAQRRSFRIP